jgi:hypothetical protein
MIGHPVPSDTGCGTVCLGMYRRRHVVEGGSYSILKGYTTRRGSVSQGAPTCQDFGDTLSSQDQAGVIFPLRAIWGSVLEASGRLRRYRK